MTYTQGTDDKHYYVTYVHNTIIQGMSFGNDGLNQSNEHRQKQKYHMKDLKKRLSYLRI